MKLCVRRLAFVTALLSSFLVACKKEAPPAQPPARTAVTVVTLRPEPVTLTRELPGRTSPSLVAEVRPQVSGLVKQRLFEEGKNVEAGQALYQLDDASYRADASSARAALARTQAALKSARLTARRIGELAKIDAVSAQDHENAIANLRQSEADVGVAQAAVQSVEVVLGHARIVAPISGRIGKSAVTQGALVTANQPEPLAIIQQLDPIYIDVTYSSTELLRMRKELAAGTLDSTLNVPVAIRMEDGTLHSQTGQFAFADLNVDPATGSFLVRVDVPNPGQLLLPGMYVRAEVSVGKRPDALLVPQPGIARTPKGDATALIVDANGKVELRAVSVDRTIGDRWLIESGLVAGDRVIVEGLQRVQPGALVEPIEQAAAKVMPAPAKPIIPDASPPEPAAPASSGSESTRPESTRPESTRSDSTTLTPASAPAAKG